MNGDPKTASLMKALANLGHEPSIVENDNLPAPNAAMYFPSSNAIQWDQASVNAAVNSGQPLGEILFHELVHAYMNFYFDGLPPNSIVTATIGAFTITYNTADPTAVNDYVHGLISGAIQAAYGTDSTGATWEAFGYNGSATEDAGVTVTTTATGAPVAAGQATLSAATKSTSSSFNGKYNPSTSVASAMAADGATCPSVTSQATKNSASSALTPGFVTSYATGATYYAH